MWTCLELFSAVLCWSFCKFVSAMTFQVTSLTRFAIKGLSGDDLTTVEIDKAGETFPNDRRFALIKDEKLWDDDSQPEWIHKQHFLCAFTAPELMSTFHTKCVEYESGDIQLNVWKRDTGTYEAPLLESVSLASPQGRQQVSQFFSQACGEPVRLVTASSKPGGEHTHQFGNTSSGWKQKHDTRTVHIVNAATVRQLSERLENDPSLAHIHAWPLRASRFRPNIVVDGVEPWDEFMWVGKNSLKFSGGLEMEVISHTVRCDGIGIDPLDKIQHKLDMPQLINKHFPEHGPYLGVYAVITKPGSIAIGDDFNVL